MNVWVEAIAAAGASLVALVGVSLRHVRREQEITDAAVEREREADRELEEEERRRAERPSVSPEVRAELFAQRRDLIRARREAWKTAWDAHYTLTTKLAEPQKLDKAAAWQGMLQCDQELDALLKEQAG